MTRYPTSNIELAQISASNNGATCTTLILPPSKEVSDHGFLLLNKYSAMTSLNLAGCSHLSDASAVLIHHTMQKLKVLDISATAITDTGISDIMTGCIHLESVSIRDNQNFKDQGCLAIWTATKTYKRMRSVDFSGSRCFSNEALIKLLMDGGILTDITLSRCKQINDLGLIGLRRHGTASTNLKNLRISTLPIHDSSMTWISEGERRHAT